MQPQIKDIVESPSLTEGSDIISLSGNEITNVLLEVSKEIRDDCSIDQLFDNVLKSLGNSGIADGILLFQLNKSNKKAILTHCYSSPYAPKIRPVGFEVDIDEAPLFKFFNKKNTFQVEDIQKYLSLPNLFFKNKYKALFMKLKTKSFFVSCGSNEKIKTIVCLHCCTRNVVWSNEIEKFIQSLVDQLTLAIDQNSEKLKKECLQKNIIKIQEKAIQEREDLLRQFASDVHDLPCSIIPLLSDAINKGDLKESERLVNELYGNLRQLINEYVVPDEDLVSFGSAIYQYINGFKKTFTGDVSIDLPEDDFHFSKKQSIELFKVLKEWFCNIKKHSKADKVTMSIKKINSLYYLIHVVDNGVGFNTKDQKIFGYGLFNIRKRLKGINAKFDIKSAPGTGTSLTIQVSLN